MRVLVLGASGMLGHKLCQVLRPDFDVWATSRGIHQELNETVGLPARRLLQGIDLLALDDLHSVLESVRPAAVVNCSGLVKQSKLIEDTTLAIKTNSLLPHQLAALAEEFDARFIHVSTDCVFSGLKGNYSETETPDPIDIYGKTKLLGEPSLPNTLVFRTSIIGEELYARRGLVSWFLDSGSPVNGYVNAMFSGLPTVVFSRVIAEVLREHVDLHGTVHVASEPISKYDLLVNLATAYGKPTVVQPVTEPIIDRSLNGSRFRAATGITFDPWSELLKSMVDDVNRLEKSGTTP